MSEDHHSQSPQYLAFPLHVCSIPLSIVIASSGDVESLIQTMDVLQIRAKNHLSFCDLMVIGVIRLGVYPLILFIHLLRSKVIDEDFYDWIFMPDKAKRDGNMRLKA